MNIGSINTINQSSIKIKFNSILKRLVDIVASAIMLILLSPLFLLIAIAIKRDSPGPVFFMGTRVGKNGKLFKMLKFRTMYEDPSSYAGPKVTGKGDPRITPMGKWLRDSKLNEFPQFWNVLIGEMSLVGPRPEDPSLEKTWPKKIRDEILSMKPGITSPATVVYHNEELMLSSDNILQQYISEIGPDKMRLDQQYVHYQSFILDLDVILWTFLILLPRIKGTTPPETMLFVGPVTRFTQRHLSWLSVDLVITLSVISFTGIIWRLITPLNAGLLQATTMALVFAVIFSITGAVMGVNKIHWQKATIFDAYNLLPAWFIASGIALYANWYFQVLPLGLVALASVISMAGFVIVRYYKRFVTHFITVTLKYNYRTNLLREKTLIIGSGRTAEQISNLLDHPSNIAKFHVVGFIDDNLFSQGMHIYGKEVLGTFREIPRILEENDIQLVLLASHKLQLIECREISKYCEQRSIKVVVIPDLYGSLNDLFVHQRVESQAQNGDHHAFVCKHCLMNATQHYNIKEIQVSSENNNQVESIVEN